MLHLYSLMSNKKSTENYNVCYNFFTVELMFLETSALTGENVEEAFLKCSRTILGKIETGKLETGMLYTLAEYTLFQELNPLTPKGSSFDD